MGGGAAALQRGDRGSRARPGSGVALACGARRPRLARGAAGTRGGVPRPRGRGPRGLAPSRRRRATSCGRSRRWASSSSGSAGRRRRSALLEEWDALRRSRGSRTPTSRLPGAGGDLPAARPGRRCAGVGGAARGERPGEGPAVVARPRGAARGLLAPDDELERSSTGRSSCTTRRPTSSRPRGRGSRTARGFGGRGGASARVRSCGAAIELFDALGAAPWSDIARAELAATGETARKRDPTTLDELTAAGAADRPASRGRTHDARGGGGDVPKPEDHRVPPAPRLPEARRAFAPRACRRRRAAALARLAPRRHGSRRAAL